nr:helix-turn-helix domain-containing protein [Rossellomorea marisflavi]
MNSIREFESFQSVTEMDSFVSEALAYFNMSKNERELLWLLAGHSVKFTGVSFLKLSTMAELLGVSKRNVQRALSALQSYGIIKRMRTIRPVKGGFGASITIICPVDLSIREEVPESVTEGSQPRENTKETIIFKAFYKDLKYIRQSDQKYIEYSFLEELLPSEFIDVVKPFVSPQVAYSLWGRVHACSRKYAPDVINLIDPAIRAFKASVAASKFKRIKSSFGGYFWGALSGILGVEQRKMIKGNNLFWDWLNEDNKRP